MRLVTSLFAWGLLASCACASLWAEEAAAERMDALRSSLRSDEPVIVAHAAFAIAEACLGGLEPELKQGVARWSASRSRRARVVVGHLMDALIRTKARPSPAWVASLAGVPRTQHLILATRAGMPGAALLRTTLREAIRGDEVCATGVLSGHLLAQRRDQELAELVLARARPELRIDVDDPAKPENEAIMIAYAFTCAHACGRSRRQDGFPSSVIYALRFEQRHDERWLLLDHPTTPVWVERRLDARASRFFGTSSNGSYASLGPLAYAWLAELLERPLETLPLRDTYEWGHKWSDAAAYRAAVARRCAFVQHHARRLAASLVGRGLLPAVRARALVPRPVVEVSDWRGHASEPLPEIAGVKVVWSPKRD